MDISIREWKEKFLNGDFKSMDVKTQCNAGWYDWFCDGSSLAKKTEFLGRKALKLFDSSKINIDKQYIWFKNNCPCVGPLYDDFRIADLHSGEVQFCICNVKRGCFGKDFNRWEVWDFSNADGGSCITNDAVVCGTWKDVEKYFGIS